MTKIFHVLNKLVTSIGYFNTIYINFKALPFKQAVKFPIVVGRRVTLIGIHKNCIRIEGNKIRPCLIQLGVQSDAPIFSQKRECSLLRCQKKSVISFNISNGGKTIFRTGFSIMNAGQLSVGENFIANQHCLFICYNKMKFGENCRIGWNCQFLDSNMHIIYDLNHNTVLNPNGDILIGKNVWFASNCCVQKNSVIPDFSIISSNSLINKDYSHITSKGNLFAGSPAKLRKTGLIRIVNDGLENLIKKRFADENADVIEMEKNFSIDTID